MYQKKNSQWKFFYYQCWDRWDVWIEGGYLRKWNWLQSIDTHQKNEQSILTTWTSNWVCHIANMSSFLGQVELESIDSDVKLIPDLISFQLMTGKRLVLLYWFPFNGEAYEIGSVAIWRFSNSRTSFNHRWWPLMNLIPWQFDSQFPLSKIPVLITFSSFMSSKACLITWTV